MQMNFHSIPSPRRSGRVVVTCDGELLCPVCGEAALHHFDVSVFSRPCNFDCDDDGVRTTRVVPGGTALFEPDGDNPSKRRDGIAVEFECENCGSSAELTIAKNGGVSLVGWRNIHPMIVGGGRP